MSARPSRLPLAKRLLFAALTLVAALGLGELAARALWEPDAAQQDELRHQGTVMSPHPTRIWAPPVGEIEQLSERMQITEDRLREVELTGAPHRAITLGDSSIFGHGLGHPDTLHAQLATALGQRGAPTDVICGAIPGYSTEQARVVMEEVGWDMRPDLLVIGALWSDANIDNFVDREWLERLRSPATRLRLLAWQSQLLQALRPLAARPDARHGNWTAVTWVQDPTAEGVRRVPLQEYAENLDALLVEATRRDVGAVMLVPSSRYRLASGALEPSVQPYERAMREVAAARGVPVIDSFDAIRASGKGPDALFLDELHPTGLGNQLYAEHLAETLVQAGWPGERLLPDPAPPPFSLPLQDPFDDPGAKGKKDKGKEDKGPVKPAPGHPTLGGPPPGAPDIAALQALLVDAELGGVELEVMGWLGRSGLPQDHAPSWRIVYSTLLIGVSEAPCAEIEQAPAREACREEARRRANAWCRQFDDLSAAGIDPETARGLPSFDEAIGLSGPEAWLQGAAQPGEVEAQVRTRLERLGVAEDLECAWERAYRATLESETPVRSARCERAPQDLIDRCMAAADQHFDNALGTAHRAGRLACEGPPPPPFQRDDDPRFLARLEAWRAEGRCTPATP
ncbi:MAG: hypothetical protein H6741_10090 [Alphaproteobacteria bacterium]|nr:hypothetical protein [Alphaproteobacteria bacterium]